MLMADALLIGNFATNGLPLPVACYALYCPRYHIKYVGIHIYYLHFLCYVCIYVD